jgi:DNA-binding NtrC family response regulator
VGARREVHADVRILAATNREPEREVEAGRMRADLYYRLASMVIRVPPLRDRRADIGPLARSMLADVRRQTRRGPERIDEGALEALEAYSWPGNVRELRNLIERAVILIDRPELRREDLARVASLGEPAPPRGDVPRAVSAPYAPRALADVAQEAAETAERAHIMATLAHTEGNKSRAAELLGISRSTLWKKLRRIEGEDG